MAKYYPCALNVSGKKCLVIGDDREADEKSARLKSAGARLSRAARPFRLSVLDRQFLVIYCYKDNLAETRRVAAACRREKILLCAIDQAAYCDVVNVSVFSRGALQIGISTGGVSPALARRVREGLESSLQNAPLEDLMSRLARIRKQVERQAPPKRRERLISAVKDISFSARIKIPKN